MPLISPLFIKEKFGEDSKIREEFYHFNPSQPPFFKGRSTEGTYQ